MPGRVRSYNAMQAAYISGQIRANGSFSLQPGGGAGGQSGAAGGPVDAGAGFCPHCGNAIVQRAQPAT